MGNHPNPWLPFDDKELQPIVDRVYPNKGYDVAEDPVCTLTSLIILLQVGYRPHDWRNSIASRADQGVVFFLTMKAEQQVEEEKQAKAEKEKEQNNNEEEEDASVCFFFFK